MQSPNERSRPVGRLLGPSGGDDNRQPTPWVADRTRIEGTVRAMSLPDLISALVCEIPEIPEDADAFACPRCQSTWHDRLMHEPAASSLGGIIWGCALCGASATRWEIETKVLTSADAVKVIMATVAEAEVTI